jgi:hypothetical protein
VPASRYRRGGSWRSRMSKQGGGSTPGTERTLCDECEDEVDIIIDEGGSHRPIGPYPVRICVVSGVAHIHYIGAGGDRSNE